MITEVTGNCQWDGCEKDATDLAAKWGGNSPVGCYCADHAKIVSDGGMYTECCPNCNCMFASG
jgi:hypothetical protein